MTAIRVDASRQAVPDTALPQKPPEAMPSAKEREAFDRLLHQEEGGSGRNARPDQEGGRNGNFSRTMTTIKTDAPRQTPPETTSTRQPSEAMSSAKEREDIDRFLEQKDERNEDLSSLMSRLYSERRGLAQEAVPAAPVDYARVAEPGKYLLDRLVRQILVSHPGQAGDREVRLTLQDSVLKDTEIRLSRGADGLLSVTLSTGDRDAFQTLVAAQTELKAQLNAHERQEVRLTVTDTPDGQQGSDDASGRRSAGYRTYDEEEEP